jgi:hypothetical protein
LHGDELNALRRAEDGDPSKLAQWVESGKPLQTEVAREFVAKKLRGETKGRRAPRRTHAQKNLELNYLLAIRDIQRELGCSEYRARNLFLSKHSSMPEDTLKTYIRRAKQTLSEKLPVPTEVQKWGNSEPEN